MSLKIILALIALAGFTGIVIGYYLRWIVALGRRGSMELEIKQMMLDAREEAKKITSEAQDRADEIIEAQRNELKEKEIEQKEKEDRLIKKEELLDTRQVDIDKDAEKLKHQTEEIKKIREKTEELHKQKLVSLERVSELTKEEAKEELLEEVERLSQETLMIRMQKLEAFGRDQLDEKAKTILTTAVHRLGNAVNADVMTTTFQIASDELKGKIIGKEGRNIKAFERATGVDVIIDDTPGTITLSSFDPIRRHVARIAMENLIADGRIQPARIEEMVEKSKDEVNRTVKEKGEQAAYECGVYNLDPRLVMLLGRLHFRTSYGQNVLQHSIEMAHIAGMLAEELGANVAIAKSGALLHDIGKAVDHEVQGTHVEIGRRILQKFNVAEPVIQAMQSHHEEYPYETPESIIVQVADALSGGRPGARRDSVENYLKRLQELESIANSFTGVERTYAIQAGREVRVFVKPDSIGDYEAKELAKKIALRIEQELKYPGEIKVTVIRENRAIEFAR
jgi:ribonuclease Y